MRLGGGQHALPRLSAGVSVPARGCGGRLGVLKTVFAPWAQAEVLDCPVQMGLSFLGGHVAGQVGVILAGVVADTVYYLLAQRSLLKAK